MHTSRFSLRRLVGAMALSCAAMASVHAQDKPESITIGYLNLVNAQLVAKGLGLHEKELGVPVKWVKFGSGGDVNRAVTADQIDFGGVGNPPAAIGITRDLPYEGIFVLNMLGPVEGLAGRKSKGVATVKDLEGKTVAVPFGSTTHYLLIAALTEAGVAPTRVKMLDMSPSDAVAAWLRKDIDAAYIWEPGLGRMVADDGQIVTDSGAMARRGFPTWDVSVVMKRFSQKYPALVTKFVKSECAAIDYWNAKPEETAQIIAKELSLPVEDARRMMKGTGMVPCSEQVKAEYLGSSTKKGRFADTLLSTSTFLVEQKRLPSVKDRAGYEAFLNPSYIERHLADPK
jgi:taurine transport system substrate-binding protein